MSSEQLTPAQRHALRMIACRQWTSIAQIDVRVRRELEAKGLLVWQSDFLPGFGRIDAEATAGRLKTKGIRP